MPNNIPGKSAKTCGGTTHKCYAADPIENTNVKSALKKAATDSDIGGAKPVEQGGWILRDPKTGELSVERLPTGKQASVTWPIVKDGKRNGKEIVGSFHTHPNVGSNWKQEPSDTDIQAVKKYPNTFGKDHYVISQDKIYHIENSGKMTEIGKTYEKLK